MAEVCRSEATNYFPAVEVYLIAGGIVAGGCVFRKRKVGGTAAGVDIAPYRAKMWEFS